MIVIYNVGEGNNYLRLLFIFVNTRCRFGCERKNRFYVYCCVNRFDSNEIDTMTEVHNLQNLLVRIAAGDTVAYDPLFRKYYASMGLYADRMLKSKSESEDLVVDLFCSLWNKRSQLYEVKSEQGYIFTLLRNKVIDLLRYKKRFQQEELMDFVSEESIEETIFEVELYVQLREAIENLPKKCAEVLRLKMEGLDDHEIAKRLGIQYETVRSHTKRGVVLLREKFDKTFLLLFF